MKAAKTLHKLLSALTLIFLTSSLQGATVTVTTEFGEKLEMEVPLKKVYRIFGISEEDQTLFVRHVNQRDYHEEVTEGEKEDIAFIVRSLANKPLTKLYQLKSSLESAGDRIDHIHPLNFLHFIFSDEEMKVGVRNIKKRGSWIWKQFMDGLQESLKEEFHRDNLTLEQIEDFAARVGIETSLVMGPIQSNQWPELVTTLIIHIPRKDSSDRYDM